MAPFHYLPSGEDKPAQENRIREVLRSSGAELLVLARYMQVLSADFAAELSGRCINIHHTSCRASPEQSLITRRTSRV